MKQLKSLSAFLMSLLLMVSCSNTDKDDLEVKPIAASGEISSFFDKHLPAQSSTPASDFSFGDKSECMIINSVDEFRQSVSSQIDNLPTIDFTKNTLVLGQARMSDPGFSFKKQSVTINDDTMTVHLEFEKNKGANPTVITYFYYWGLYEKLPEKPTDIDLNIG